jgi:hypothetical protein
MIVILFFFNKRFKKNTVQFFRWVNLTLREILWLAFVRNDDDGSLNETIDGLLLVSKSIFSKRRKKNGF